MSSMTQIFLTQLSGKSGTGYALAVNCGHDPSDVLDTCLNVLARAADILIADTDALLAALKKRAFEYKMMPTIGRSHGIHAELTTFGVKLATYWRRGHRSSAALLLVTEKRYRHFRAISGKVVGTFANIDPKVEEHVAKAMGLSVEPVSTQVIPRDRHAAYFAALGVVDFVAGTAGDRDPPFAAHRSAGGRGTASRPARKPTRRPRTPALRNPGRDGNVTGLARIARELARSGDGRMGRCGMRFTHPSTRDRPRCHHHLDFPRAGATTVEVIEQLLVYLDRMQNSPGCDAWARCTASACCWR